MIKFGTSGFRGIIADNYTKENVQRIAHALCELAKEDKLKKPEIVMGYDNRFMSKNFAIWVSEVLSTTFKVMFYSFSTPTPLICYETKERDFGIMLTASHNPYNYNGIKVLLRGGRDCDDEYAKRIEKIANNVKYSNIRTIDFDKAVKAKKIVLIDDIKSYCDKILSFVNTKKIQKSSLKVLVNSMHGNGSACARYLFDKLKLNYEIMNENIDPYFEGGLPAPYKHNLEAQAKRVVDENFDLGFAFDGDSDRFALISSSGTYYDCNFVAVVLYYFLVKHKKSGASITNNYAFTTLASKLAEAFGKNCYESKVGFKNIAKLLIDTDSILGAESNGIAFKPLSLTKDGLASAVLVVEALSTIGKSFDEILDEIQTSINFKSEIVEYAYPVSAEKNKEIYKLIFKDKKLPDINGKKIVKVVYDDGCKIIYENGYWVMVRFSGTEPLIRLFAEMKDLKDCNKVIAQYEKHLGIKVRQ